MSVCLLVAATLLASARASIGALRTDALAPECADLGCRVLRAAGALRRWLDGESDETLPRDAAPARTAHEAQQRAGAAIMDAINKHNARFVRDKCGESSDAAALHAVQMAAGAQARECSEEAKARGVCE